MVQCAGKHAHCGTHGSERGGLLASLSSFAPLSPYLPFISLDLFLPLNHPLLCSTFLERQTLKLRIDVRWNALDAHFQSIFDQSNQNVQFVDSV